MAEADHLSFGPGNNPGVGFVHDWLTNRAGSELVLEAMLACFPPARIHTAVYWPDRFRNSPVAGASVKSSFIERLPWGRSRYRAWLPLMPLAFEQFDLSPYDLVISSSHAVAKGVITGPDQLHISYVHSPMRYAWDLQHQYLSEAGLDRGVRSWVTRWLLHRLRQWDVRTANGVDHFVANSEYIARRIWKVYRREATVIYPPVDVDRFVLRGEKEDFYLTASRLVPYKRIGLIVRAFSELMPEKRLIVIGDGPGMDGLRRVAGRNVELLGYQDDEVLCDYMQRARAFVFAAEEDFGIVPVEAQACGTPVVAFGRGGCRETVVDGRTGVLFAEQSERAVADAVARFERIEDDLDPEVIRTNAERFSTARFRREFSAFVDECWRRFSEQRGF